MLIDALVPRVHDVVLELLRKGVKIYLLKDTTTLKKLREKNGFKKSDEINAKLLEIIPISRFKQLTLKEANLLKLIEEYEKYVRWRRIVCNK